MCLLGVSLILLPILRVKYPKTLILGREQTFSSRTGKILKVLCYRNYYIDFNQIWRNNRDHQVVTVGGPSMRPTNPRWWTAAILKTVKLPSLQPFDRFWWNLARWRILSPYNETTVKISNFRKSKMALAAILKITKIAISPQRFDRSLRNFVCWCKMGLLTAPTIKIWISQIQDCGRPQCALPAGRPYFSMHSIWGMLRA